MADNKVLADGGNNIQLDNNIRGVVGNNFQAEFGANLPPGNNVNAIPANLMPPNTDVVLAAAAGMFIVGALEHYPTMAPAQRYQLASYFMKKMLQEESLKKVQEEA